jgi:hypothetical protein
MLTSTSVSVAYQLVRQLSCILTNDLEQKQSNYHLSPCYCHMGVLAWVLLPTLLCNSENERVFTFLTLNLCFDNTQASSPPTVITEDSHPAALTDVLSVPSCSGRRGHVICAGCCCVTCDRSVETGLPVGVPRCYVTRSFFVVCPSLYTLGVFNWFCSDYINAVSVKIKRFSV